MGSELFSTIADGWRDFKISAIGDARIERRQVISGDKSMTGGELVRDAFWCGALAAMSVIQHHVQNGGLSFEDAVAATIANINLPVQYSADHKNN